MTHKRREIYRAVVLRIARDLGKKQCKEPRFLCTGLVPRRVKGVLTLFCSLEEAARMSWVDVTFLKERLHNVGREDLVDKPDRVRNKKKPVHSSELLYQKEE